MRDSQSYVEVPQSLSKDNSKVSLPNRTSNFSDVENDHAQSEGASQRDKQRRAFTTPALMKHK